MAKTPSPNSQLLYMLGANKEDLIPKQRNEAELDRRP